MDLLLVGLGCLLIGGAVSWLLIRSAYAARLAAAVAHRDVLRDRVVDLEAVISQDSETAQLVGPLRASLERVATQVHALERERVAQFAEVAAELTRVSSSTDRLGEETASLVGSLNASSVRGAWGEVQLRRVLEHSGMLARCDFDEQVTVRGGDGRRLRPDVVVRLPGDRQLVVDAKAPMTAFLAAQAEARTAAERSDLMAAHAKALRAHVDTLAAKEYWSAFDATPEMVVCFVPGEAFLAVALAHDPDLHEYALRRRVVVASPATLFALLRTVAYTWRQEAVAGSARELLAVGRELYARLGSLGRHTSAMGAALARSVEAYNGFVGSLESRVLTTARRMHDLGVVEDPLPASPPLTVAPRPLTALELIEALEPDVRRPDLDLDVGGMSSGASQAGVRRPG